MLIISTKICCYYHGLHLLHRVQRLLDNLESAWLLISMFCYFYGHYAMNASQSYCCHIIFLTTQAVLI